MTLRRLGDGDPDSLDERAVSDVVGYVLVFALVTATLAAVFAVGFVGLEERQNAERVENVERAFDVFDDNVRDIQRYEDPSRATEIRLSGGTLSLEQQTTMTLEYEYENETVENESIPMSTLTYTNGDTTLAYEGGAWFRVDGDRATMRSPPRFVENDNRTVLPVVQLLEGRNEETIRTDGTVQVSTGSSGDRTLEYTTNESSSIDEIRLRIESPYADAWNEFLKGSIDDDPERPSDEVTVAVLDHDDMVYLREISVDVSLRR